MRMHACMAAHLTVDPVECVWLHQHRCRRVGPREGRGREARVGSQLGDRGLERGRDRAEIEIEQLVRVGVGVGVRAGGKGWG